MKSPRLVCILGAESTGKTTLAQQLAAAMGGHWVPEYLRAFCDLHVRTPRREEQTLILETQLMHERAAAVAAAVDGAPLVFCDTAPLTTAIYSDHVFGDDSLYARARALHVRYALTLLCLPDLGWVADGHQRDGPEAQARIHRMMENELKTLALPFTRVSGTGVDRLAAAIASVGQMPGRSFAQV